MEVAARNGVTSAEKVQRCSGTEINYSAAVVSVDWTQDRVAHHE